MRPQPPTDRRSLKSTTVAAAAAGRAAVEICGSEEGNGLGWGGGKGVTRAVLLC